MHEHDDTPSLAASLVGLQEHLRTATPEAQAAFACLQAACLGGESGSGALPAIFRELVEHSPATLYHLDFAGDRYGYVSPSVAQLTGFDREQFLATPFSEMAGRLHPDDYAKILVKTRSLASRGGGRINATFEYRFRNAAGEWRWFSDWATLIYDSRGELATVIGSAFDISAQRDVLQALRENEQRYRLLADNSADVICTFDLAFRLTYVSPSVTRTLGWTPQEMLRMSFEDFMTPQALGVAREGFGRRMARERAGTPMHEAQRNEMLFRRKDGRVSWFECVTSPLRDEHGALTGILVAARDISERKEAEESLKRSEARLRMALEATSDGVFDILLPYPATDVDPGCILTDESGNGETSSPFIHPDDVQTVQAALRTHLDGRSERFAAEYRMMLPEGSRRWTLSRGRIVEWDRDAGTVRLIGTHTDIEGRRQAEEALRREEEKFRALVENQTGVVIKFAPDGRLLYVSPSCCRLFDCREQDLLGRNITDFIHPDDRSGFDEAVRALSRPPHVAVYEKRMPTRHGWRWISCTDTPILDKDGRLAEIIGVGRDVTEQRALEADLRAAKEEAEAASRAKSEFLANMSHEIRNPLNAVLGLADLLLMGDLPPEQRERATLLKNSASSLLGVISDILDYSKIEAGGVELEREPFDPAALARSLVDEQQVLADEKGIGLRLTLSPRLPRVVVGDGTKTRQILLNLVANAIKFTDEGSVEVIVRTAERHADGPTLLFAVADTGIGVPPGMQDAIFESFRQAESGLRKRHGGTGLGLAISKRMVEIMGGRIWFQSEQGRGSVFCFTAPVLPARARKPQAGRPAPAEAALPPLSLLLVEDDWINRHFTAQLLERHGHRAALAENGAQALEMLAAQPFDAVIMDMQMPIMDGLSATQAIRSGRAPDGGVLPCDVPVVGLTAYAAEESRQRFLAAGADACLIKPLRMERLLSILRDIRAGDAGPDGGNGGERQADLLDERQIDDHMDAGAASFAALLGRFAGDAAMRLERIAAAMHSGDARDAAMTAHTMAGAAGMMGAAALRRHCLRLEASILAGEDGVAETIAAAARLMEQSVAAIRGRLGVNSPKTS